MPSQPYVVSGVVYNSSANNIANAVITFESSAGKKSVISDYKGQYILDLADINYDAGETISYNSYDKFDNEHYSGTFIVSGESKSLDINLSERLSALSTKGNRDVVINTLGGKPISLANPLPIVQTSIPMGDGSFTLEYTGANLTKVTKVVGSDTYVLNLGYSGANLITVSKWVKS